MCTGLRGAMSSEYTLCYMQGNKELFCLLTASTIGSLLTSCGYARNNLYENMFPGMQLYIDSSCFNAIIDGI